MANNRELFEYANYTFEDLVDKIVELENNIVDLEYEIEKLQNLF
jgi:hypothetical protein